MVDASFAMAMAAATPGPLGGGCWALRYCVDYPAFSGSILRCNAGPELLSGDTHCRHISWMARGHLYYGRGNSCRVVLVRAPDQMLLPVIWGIVGTVNIGVIIGLQTLARQLAEANDRQRLLFQELQHRVANTLQSTVGTLERIKRTITSNPTESANLLNQAIERMFVSADIHRRLHDPTLFDSGLEPILREVAAALIDQETVIVNWKIERIALSLDQMSILAMLVLEIANNAAKHVFQPNLGSYFEVELKALPGRRVMLKVSDNGPGVEDSVGKQGLGVEILEGLTDQINGTLTIAHDHGTTVRVDFPAISA
jgi:two-component sensor histidine kinase